MNKFNTHVQFLIFSFTLLFFTIPTIAGAAYGQNNEDVFGTYFTDLESIKVDYFEYKSDNGHFLLKIPTTAKKLPVEVINAQTEQSFKLTKSYPVFTDGFLVVNDPSGGSYSIFIQELDSKGVSIEKMKKEYNSDSFNNEIDKSKEYMEGSGITNLEYDKPYYDSITNSFIFRNKVVSPEGNPAFSVASVHIGKDLMVNVTISAIDPISDERLTYFKDNIFNTFVFNKGFKYIENNSSNNVSKALTAGLVSGLFMSTLALVVIMVRRDKKDVKDSQLSNGHNKPKVKNIDSLKNIFYKVKKSRLTKIFGIMVFFCLVIYLLYFAISKPKRITKECIENAVAKAVKNDGDQSDVRYYYWKCEKEHGIKD